MPFLILPTCADHPKTRRFTRLMLSYLTGRNVFVATPSSGDLPLGVDERLEACRSLPPPQDQRFEPTLGRTLNVGS